MTITNEIQIAEQRVYCNPDTMVHTRIYFLVPQSRRMEHSPHPGLRMEFVAFRHYVADLRKVYRSLRRTGEGKGSARFLVFGLIGSSGISGDAHQLSDEAR